MKKLITIATILSLISSPFFAENHDIKGNTKNDPPVAIPPTFMGGPPVLLPPCFVFLCVIGCGKDGTSSTPTTPSTPATPSYSM